MNDSLDGWGAPARGDHNRRAPLPAGAVGRHTGTGSALLGDADAGAARAVDRFFAIPNLVAFRTKDAQLVQYFGKDSLFNHSITHNNLCEIFRIPHKPSRSHRIWVRERASCVTTDESRDCERRLPLPIAVRNSPMHNLSQLARAGVVDPCRPTCSAGEGPTSKYGHVSEPPQTADIHDAPRAYMTNEMSQSIYVFCAIRKVLKNVIGFRRIIQCCCKSLCSTDTCSFLE